ncbi:class I SAM-dependent methyltransferase, partial [Desulfosporosinus fructosivorans]
MDKNSVYRTNSFFWDTKGNDILGATALPFYGAFVS